MLVVTFCFDERLLLLLIYQGCYGALRLQLSQFLLQRSLYLNEHLARLRILRLQIIHINRHFLVTAACLPIHRQVLHIPTH